MIEVYTDGASRGNPGLSGAGIYLKAHNRVYEYAYPLKQMSNHEAEMHAVIHALDICQEKFPNDIISCRSDSQIVVDMIEKNHTKNRTFLPLLKRIQSQAETFPYFFIKWIPEKENYHADRLAKKALDIHTY